MKLTRLSSVILVALLLLLASPVRLGAQSPTVGHNPSLAQSVQILQRSRLGNDAEDITFIGSGPLAGNIAVMDGYDVIGVATQGGVCATCGPRKLFDVRRLAINTAPRGIAYIESAGLFALNDPTQPTKLFFVDDHGQPKGTRTIQYLGGFSPGWLEGLAYIPESSPVFPGDLIQVALAPGESRLEVIQSDGQVAAEIIPAEPLHSSSIAGVSFLAPDQILVGLDDNTMWELDFDGNILAGPITLDGVQDIEGIVQLSSGDVAASAYDAGRLLFFDQNLNRLPNKDRAYKIGLGVSGPRGVAWNTDTNQHLVAYLGLLPQTSAVVAIPPGLGSATQVVDLSTDRYVNTFTMSYLPNDHLIALGNRNLSAIQLYDNSGNLVDQIDVSQWGPLVALGFIPSTNQYATAFLENPLQLLILDRRGNLVRVIDLSSAGISAVDAVTFFNPGDPTGGEFLMVVTDVTDPYRQFLMITDFNGNSRGRVDIRKTFGLLEVNDVSAITTGPQTGAFSIVDLLDSEIVIFRLQTRPGFAYVANRGSNNVSAFLIDNNTGALTNIHALTAAESSPFGAGREPIFVVANDKFAFVADLASFQVSGYTIDQRTGALKEVPGSPFDGGPNPQSLCLSPAGRFLYAIDSDGQKGSIAAWSVDPTTGALTVIPGSPYPAGATPNWMAFSRGGKFAYVTDLASNQVLGYATDQHTGALVPIAGSPFGTGLFPWSIAAAPAADFVYVTNSGSNNISAYKINGTGALSPIAGSPFMAGSAPLSITIDPTEMFTYVTNAVSSNISAYIINPDTGALETIVGSPFGAGMSPNSAVVDPSRRFLYANNTGSNNISAYAIDPATGSLAEVPGSPFPESGAEPSSIAVSGLLVTGH